MRIIILAGPPGSGKGTQAQLLADDFGYYHLSTGEILRKEIAAGTKLGKLAQARIDNGNFVPDYVACEMIRNFLGKSQCLKGVVFDGFPRTLNQCVELEPMLERYDTKVHMFVDIFVEEENLTKRLLHRNQSQGRPDDSDLSIIKHRFDLYNDLTKPVVDYYRERKNYYQVNGNNPVNDVFKELKELIINNVN